MACLRAKVLLLSLVVGSVRPAHLPSTPSCAAVAVAGTAQFARPLHAAASSRCCTTSPTHCCVACCSSSCACSSAGAARAGYDAAPSVDADHVAQQPLGVGTVRRADGRFPDLAPSPPPPRAPPDTCAHPSLVPTQSSWHRPSPPSPPAPPPNSRPPTPPQRTTPPPTTPRTPPTRFARASYPLQLPPCPSTALLPSTLLRARPAQPLPATPTTTRIYSVQRTPSSR